MEGRKGESVIWCDRARCRVSGVEQASPSPAWEPDLFPSHWPSPWGLAEGRHVDGCRGRQTEQGGPVMRQSLGPGCPR